MIAHLIEPIRSRGPDDEGLCVILRDEGKQRLYKTGRTASAAAAGLDDFRDTTALIPHDVALINTRYAIIDRSPGGHQPFVSRDGSVTAVFNGEIYNYVELRNELKQRGVVFRTASDTEVLVEGYRVWRDDIWSKLNGFWAVALYDLNDRAVRLSRDRLGVAPLYYRETKLGLYFASLITPLLQLGDRMPAPDVEVLTGFMETQLKDFDSATCFSGIKSLPPATTVRLVPGEYDPAVAYHNRYWSYPSSPLSTKDITLTEAVEWFRETFLNAVQLRLRADVKLAFELSGGLDSSSIVVAAAALGTKEITTYTISVPESDEEPYARAILDRYDVDYRVLTAPEDTFFEDAQQFLGIMEEPFHAPNIYTHYKMRRLMKEDGVGIVLSGSGGDEVLAGYEWDFWQAAFAQLRRDGHFTHGLLCDLVMKFKSRLRTAETFKYKTLTWIRRARRLRELVGLATTGNAVSPGTDGSGATLPLEQNRALAIHEGYASLDYYGQRLYHLKVGLQPYYLRSNDHFTMSIPLEHRLPFLDYRIVEFGLQVPVPYLFNRGWTKYVLRKAMEPMLPPEIVWRPEKMGFPFPFRRFLSDNRQSLQPTLASVVSAGLASTETDYDSLLNRNPLKLWRICSVGMWLDEFAGTSP
jgi:asparagine synthase (glutamine-hydrolysing)